MSCGKGRALVLNIESPPLHTIKVTIMGQNHLSSKNVPEFPTEQKFLFSGQRCWPFSVLPHYCRECGRRVVKPVPLFQSNIWSHWELHQLTPGMTQMLQKDTAVQWAKLIVSVIWRTELNIHSFFFHVSLLIQSVSSLFISTILSIDILLKVLKWCCL